ncbi:hypothetical protein N656DRAFT_842373 [Canariomyces notabilis]|uniref:Uncharacterized protein n=1 Tax=Canariomyces notabilis TaxID=2074819 RepID=A0AAN6TJC3_9PEZI|nr:hypothetical protein N656DRAFT_842373 [Canariomyces arenarius]
MAANKGTTPPSPPSSPCLLNELSVDIVINILSASNTLADLSALIHASPFLYNCFLLAKASILRTVITNELGPAVRDAFVLANTDMLTNLDFETKLDKAVKDYHRHHLAENAPWVTGIDAHTAAKMARLTRTVLFFVDIYTRVRLAYFRERSDDESVDWPATLTERRRIAQALLRWQTVINMRGDAMWEEWAMYESFLAKVVPLFESWELAQISDMDCFIYGLTSASAIVQFNNRRQGSPRGTVNLNLWRDAYYDQYFPSLIAFHANLRDAQRTHSAFLETVMRSHTVWYTDYIKPRSNGSMWLESSHWAPGGIEIPAQATKGYSSGPIEGTIDKITFKGETPLEPPWAWLHAWDGLRVNRWGAAMIPKGLPDGVSFDELEEIIRSLKLWRWLGLMFWDKDRAEKLLESVPLGRCEHGWLAAHMMAINADDDDGEDDADDDEDDDDGDDDADDDNTDHDGDYYDADDVHDFFLSSNLASLASLFGP